MTAIFGAVRYDAADPLKDTAVLQRVLGPLGDGPDPVRSEGLVSIGCNLKHLLDEDAFDRQPLGTPDARYLVVADIRLTERDDLIAQLGLADAATASDAMLAAAALERWHEDAFDRLYGCFAIAAWDRVGRRLLLARDHFGYRPLVFHLSAERFCFASTASALRALPGVPHSIDAFAMRHFLRFGEPPRRQTCFAGIEQVAPGHFAIVANGEVAQRRYWKPDLTPLQLPNHDAYATEFRRQFERAVAASLRGVGDRVAAHLSAGFDSSAVVTTAATMLKSSGARISAYTAVPRAGFAENKRSNELVDEGDLAVATAARYDNIDHRRVAGAESPLANLDRDAAVFGEPPLNLCNQTWVDAINDAARADGCRVLLLGAMGNASISETGTSALPELFRSGRMVSWFRIAKGFVRSRRMRWNNVLWRTAAPFLSNRAWLRLRNLRGRETASASHCSPLRGDVWREETVLAEARNADVHPLDREWTAEWGRQARHSLDERLGMMNVDMGNYYKGVLATWGLDWRDPTGDRRLCEFALRVPVEHLAWQGETKALLRAYLADKVPPEVLDNPRTGVQAADWSMGFGGAMPALTEEVRRIADFDASAELIDVPRVERLIQSWPEAVAQGRLNTVAGNADYRLVVLRAISASAFMRKASGSNY